SGLVLDADALNALARHTTRAPDWTYAGGEVVLTPHIGEMARLCGLPTEEVAGRQAELATDFARRHRCVVVLKSHITVVASPHGEVLVNDSAGNAGLAKGGSGDVLAGLIAGLLAQGLPAFSAAGAGVWLHAAAGDLAAKASGLAGLSPAELPAAIAQVLKSLGR
ncbi:MAG: NAD(P)H-hydrate dehydratase, partial [Oscillospiraceae bacterium]